MNRTIATCLLLTIHLCVIGRAADIPDEFKVKRQAPCEFTQKPTITRDGDRVTIAFATKAFCDATVAIEDETGKIVRHLASGVLGANAPAPFQRDSLTQSIVWDSKDDAGRYIDAKTAVSVRVSLGLRATFDKSLFSSPHKRIGAYPPIMSAAKEGVYVFEGKGVDSLRLYDHAGDYVRTIYPFSAGKLDKIVGLKKQAVLQTGQELPVKLGYQQATLLTSGTTALTSDLYMFGDGCGASTMAVCKDRIALTYLRVNRLATDGTSGGLPLDGANTGFSWRSGEYNAHGPYDIGPTSSAFDPTGKWLYVTGYIWKHGIYDSGGHCRHVVSRIAYAEDGEPGQPKVFAGAALGAEIDADLGSDDAHFTVPTSVACDAKGRVYVADYMNDRVQVFDPDGKFLKTIRSPKPTRVQVDPRNGEVYVFSWFLGAGVENQLYRRFKCNLEEMHKMPATLTRFGPFDKPDQLATWKLPMPRASAAYFTMGQLFHVELDFFAPTLTLWAVPRKGAINKDDVLCWGSNIINQAGGDDWLNCGILLLTEQDGQWKVQRDFAADAKAKAVRVKPPDLGIQRLFVSPVTHRLYVLEHQGFAKAHGELLEIDPETGKIRPLRMPFQAEDICFDDDGRIYLRTDREVVRYELPSWREVPWDYGEERKQVTFGGEPACPAISALEIPGQRPMWFHQYGMAVSHIGHLAVSCCNAANDAKDRFASGAWKGGQADPGKPYVPTIYPGRARHQEIHIWDKQGKLVRQDAVPGLGTFNGIGIDSDDSIYVMSQGLRNLDGKAYPNNQTGTLVKFRPQKQWGDVKIISSTQNTTKRYVPFAPLPLSKDLWPKRPPDTVGGMRETGSSWMDGAEWFYGGVGIVGGGCNCWHTRFAMDGFARSVAPRAGPLHHRRPGQPRQPDLSRRPIRQHRRPRPDDALPGLRGSRHRPPPVRLRRRQQPHPEHEA